ncbi:hypothetical protein [Bordetella bronchiseptica]|uniref:hypothetical protein n=1 Tax=Bordetella bronchiseptica TaxID=518 RepID=UPI001F2E3777|nr:hypothetical protein [Bordetella bronchiseptica]
MGRPAAAARRADTSTTARARQQASSNASHAMNGACGRRMAMISATSTLLSTPPTKIEIVPNRPASSAWRMSSGTFRPGSASQRVTGQAGGL